MSEYWKSVPRKFCDFCKCWITDNKPSVDFHERGKKHQENVERRLKEVRKRSYENSLEQETIDKQMEKMEKAALEAFKKDLAGNPELAKQYGVSLEPKSNPKADKEKIGDKKEKSADCRIGGDKEESASSKEWWEAKSPEGYSYYWSTITGKSVWEPPDEFMSLEEQKAEEEKKPEETSTGAEETSEDRIEEVEKPHFQQITMDPSFSRSAFGAWNVVREESQPVIYNASSKAPTPEEIPLPEDVHETVPLLKDSGPKFKEKTVSSLGPVSEKYGSTTFKKRKIASGARNVRKRDDDD